MWGEITTWLTPGQFTLRHIHIYIRDNSTVFLLFFFLVQYSLVSNLLYQVTKTSHLTIPSSHCAIPISHLTILLSHLVFFFLHLTVLFSHCAVLASYVTVLSHIWWFPYFFSYCPVLISHLTVLLSMILKSGPDCTVRSENPWNPHFCGSFRTTLWERSMI